MQGLFAVIILRLNFGYAVLEWAGERFTEFIQYAEAGAVFCFGATFKEHFIVFGVQSIRIFR